MQKKISEKKWGMNELLFLFITIIYISLDSRYRIPYGTYLRWGLPLILLVICLIKKVRVNIYSPSTYLFVIFSFFISTFISNSFMYSFQRFASFILITVMYIVYFGRIKKKEKFNFVIDTISIPILLYGVLNVLFVILFDSSLQRAYGITANPNSLGVWSTQAFIVALYMGNKTNIKFKKGLCYLLAILFIFTTIRSGSRTYTVVIIMDMFLCYLIFSKKNYWTKTLVLVFISILILFFGLEKIFEIIPGLNRLIEQGTDRGNLWLGGEYLISQKPILGWGYGVSQSLNSSEYLGDFYDVWHDGMAFHNSYLTITIENGILGLIAVLLFIIIRIIPGFLQVIKNKNITQATAVIMILNFLMCFYSGSGMTSVGSPESFIFWGIILWLGESIKRKKFLSKL